MDPVYEWRQFEVVAEMFVFSLQSIFSKTVVHCRLNSEII